MRMKPKFLPMYIYIYIYAIRKEKLEEPNMMTTVLLHLLGGNGPALMQQR